MTIYEALDANSYNECVLKELEIPLLRDKNGQKSDNELIIRSLLEDFTHLKIMTTGQLFRWLGSRLGCANTGQNKRNH